MHHLITHALGSWPIIAVGVAVGYALGRIRPLRGAWRRWRRRRLETVIGRRIRLGWRSHDELNRAFALDDRE